MNIRYRVDLTTSSARNPRRCSMAASTRHARCDEILVPHERLKLFEGHFAILIGVDCVEDSLIAITARPVGHWVLAAPREAAVGLSFWTAVLGCTVVPAAGPVVLPG